MTNTIQRTLADTSGFIPQAWANEALDVLRRNIVLAKFVAKDSDFSQGAWKGKTLNIPYPGTFSARQDSRLYRHRCTPSNGARSRLHSATTTR